MSFAVQQIDLMASPAPFIKQELREEEETFFSSSPSTIQNDVSYASLNTSIGSYKGRIFIRSQPHSIMEHGLDSLVGANRKRSREQFDHDIDVGIKQEPMDMRPRKKFVTERYHIVAPTLRDDLPNLRWDEETPTPEPEEEHRQLYTSYADAYKSQALHPASASSDTTTWKNVNTNLSLTSVPGPNHNHCGSTPGFDDDYIPFDNATRPEEDEDSGFFEAEPNTVPQHPTAEGRASSFIPFHEAYTGSPSGGYMTSAKAGSKDSAGNDRLRNAQQIDARSYGQYSALVEELSSFDENMFELEHVIDYMSNYGTYSDHQAQSLGPKYDQENIDPTTTTLFALAFEPEPSHAPIPASNPSRKRSLSQFADEYILEAEISPSVRRKVNGLFNPSRDSFHTSSPLPSSPPRLRHIRSTKPFVRSTRSVHDDAELRRDAHSITTGYNPGWSNDYSESRGIPRHTESRERWTYATPPRVHSGTPETHYTPKTSLPQPQKAFPDSPHVYGAGFRRREFRYVSPDAIHGHYIGTQATRSRESSVDILEKNLNDIDRYERHAHEAAEELSTTESSISKLRAEARHDHSSACQSEFLRDHWKGEARKVKKAVREARIEEGRLKNLVSKVNKARDLLLEAQDILESLADDEDLAEFENEREDQYEQLWEPEYQQEQWSQSISMAYEFQGGDAYDASQWNWLEGDYGY